MEEPLYEPMDTIVMNVSWFDENDEFEHFKNNTYWIHPNDSMYYDFDNTYEVPTTILVVLSILYGSISVLAVVGNSLVMWIVATSRRMQNVTNFFIANLALADIVIGLFAIPFQFQAALLQRWNLPYFMCAFCPFVQVLSVNVSVFTLTAIAIDRHRAILRPLSAKPSKLTAKIIIAGIWFLAGGLATPNIIARRVVLERESFGAGADSYKPFCKHVNLSDTSMLIYTGLLVFLQYLTPLSIISCVYARMALKLWGNKAPGNAEDSRDANLMKNKIRVIKMLIIVVALFAICWLPLQTYNIFQYFHPKINEYEYIHYIWFCCDWLAMSNSCYNPFIYGIYNEKFRREFQQRCPFKSRKWLTNPPIDITEMDKTQSTRTSVRIFHTERIRSSIEFFVKAVAHTCRYIQIFYQRNKNCKTNPSVSRKEKQHRQYKRFETISRFRYEWKRTISGNYPVVSSFYKSVTARESTQAFIDEPQTNARNKKGIGFYVRSGNHCSISSSRSEELYVFQAGKHKHTQDLEMEE